VGILHKSPNKQSKKKETRIMNKIVQYAMMFLFALASVFPLYSAFTMTSSVISNGGMINSGDGNSVTLSATVGESVIGDSENSAGDVQLFSGFWHTCLSIQPQQLIMNCKMITSLIWQFIMLKVNL